MQPPPLDEISVRQLCEMVNISAPSDQTPPIFSVETHHVPHTLI
jgi:hypothetical protein